MELHQLLNTLVEHSSEENISVTLTMKTHRLNNDAEQDPVRFKNLLKEIGQKLDAKQWDEKEIDQLLAKFRKLGNKHRFWLEQDESLVVFANKNFFHHIKLPIEVKSATYVDNYFFIKPLLRLQTFNKPFFILALSKNDNRLLKATRLGVESIKLNDIPDSYDEFTKLDVFETSQDSQAGASPGNVHGKGDAAEDKQQLLLQYIKHIEKGVTTELRNHGYPLIVAGVEHIFAQYKKINHYDNLLEDEYIKGNPDHMSESELHKAGWAIAKQFIDAEIKSIVEESADLTNTNRFIHDVNKIVKAAYYGQVDRLFLKTNTTLPGFYDKNGEEVMADNQSETDLTNLAAVECMKKSGEVLILENGALPNNAEVSAVLRYPVST